MGFIKDCLIVRSDNDEDNPFMGWLGEGLKEILEKKRWSVIDLSENEATPSNVHYWLRMETRRISKMFIYFGNGYKDRLTGKLDNNEIDIITKPNVATMTRNLDVFSFAPNTAGENSIGELAVSLGCHSWLGFNGEIGFDENYADELKSCLFSYILAFADRESLHNCTALLREGFTSLSAKSELLKPNEKNLVLLNKYD